MEKAEMIKRLIDYYTEGNKSKFAILLGIRPQTINSWEARNTFDAELIYAKCENVSGDWLLSGNGDMLRNSGNVQIGTSGDNIQQTGNNCSVGNVTSGSQDQTQETESLRQQLKSKEKEVADLERLIDEKERLIQVLLNKK